MNLLSNRQESDLIKRILSVLRQLGITEEENVTDSEMEKARKFFDFSKEIDLSLLEGLKIRKLNYDVVHHDSCRLFEEMLRLPKSITMEATDRYILFLDALAGDTIGRFIYNYSYMYENTEANTRIHHAYERKYPIEELQPKMLAYSAYGLNKERLLYSKQLLLAAAKNPRDLYRGGKYYCTDNWCFSRERLYSLALAYRKQDSFTSDELNEMEKHLLMVEKSMSSNYNIDLENLILMLFMSINYGAKIRNRFQARFKVKSDTLLKAILQYIPTDYFIENMDIVAETAEISDNMTIDKMIKITVQGAVVANAFTKPNQGNQCKNSVAFLELLAKKYTEHFIEAMSSNEPIGVGAKWGYMFDYYNDLCRVLEKSVPDAKERYNFDAGNAVIENTINREVIDVKNSVRRQVMDYLKGNADIIILDPIRAELNENHKQWSAMQHEVNMLKQLTICGEFYGRYVSYKFIQNPAAIEDYINYYFRYSEVTEAINVMKQVYKMAIENNVPIGDRLKLFELIFERNNYWEDRKKAITEAAIDIMTENSESYDEIYAVECPKHEVVTRCCYALYLEKSNYENRNKDRLIAICQDSSKEVRRTVTEIIGKHMEYRSEVTDMLTAKKQAVRETAVDIIALWGAENYRDALTSAAEREKSAKLADKIRAILSAKVSNSNNGDQVFSPIAFVEDIHKGGRARKISWLFDTAVPEVHFKSGALADEKYMQALILCYSTMPVPGRNENAFLLAAELNDNELHRYAAEVFSHWHSAGAESKTKWAMYFAVIHGGDSIVEIALKCIKDWAENMRGAIASETVKAIALNGSPFALMTVDNLAHKFKHKQIKKAAVEAMENAAEALGITADELGDRIVPDLGFDENMERIFDYGDRKFRVCLSPSLELEVYDDNGKKLKTMPAPGKKDDETLANQSNAEFKGLKKQLKNVLSIQSVRLETALLADRRWSKEAWESLYVKNPVMHSFAIGLIWAAYSGEDVTTFRYMEDGTFNTVDEDEFEIPDDCRIGLVHPIDLDEETLSAWKEQLSDYEIIQPITQLERPIYRIKNEEINTLDLNRFNGKSINALSLMGRATKLGWGKGSAQDAGMFYVFYREDVTERVKAEDGSYILKGTAAEMHFSGCYIAVENEEVTIENVRFYHPGTIEHGSYVYDEADNEKAIPLEKVPPRYFSEIVYQLEIITKGTEGVNSTTS